MSGPVLVLDGKISNFPYPLYPKNKNPYSQGFRFVIPENSGIQTFNLAFPNQDLELVQATFTASGYNDGDYWSLIIDNNYIAKEIYTKEVGQVKQLKVIKKVVAGSTNHKFLFNNESSSSKIIWLDLDFVCKQPILYT